MSAFTFRREWARKAGTASLRTTPLCGGPELPRHRQALTADAAAVAWLDGGAGELHASGRTYPVAYELDRFEDLGGQRANGSISGDVHELLAAGEDSAAILDMGDGLKTQAGL